jgi:hypothetical protein
VIVSAASNSAKKHSRHGSGPASLVLNYWQKFEKYDMIHSEKRSDAWLKKEI